MMICVTDRVENIVGKGENAGYQHFLRFPQCFQKPYFPGSSKVGIMWERVNEFDKIIKAVNLVQGIPCSDKYNPGDFIVV